MCIARQLHEIGCRVDVWVLRENEKQSDDFVASRAKLNGLIVPREISEGSVEDLNFQQYDLLIDAVLGSGLSRPVTGLIADVIEAMNVAKAGKVAVDVPSGLFIDRHSTGKAFQADYTITFGAPKLAFLFPENAKFVGEWHGVDIGLDEKIISETTVQHYYVDENDISEKLKVRAKFANKGEFGKALLIAGSFGKMGAAVMSARAALRAGLGLLTVHIPGAGYDIMQTSVPEAMAMVDKHEEFFTEAGPLEKFDVIGIGPGIGQEKLTASALAEVMRANKPMVIDADALNLLGLDKDLLKLIPYNSILTPHPKEFERIVGKWNDDFERLEMQKNLAKACNVVIVLKGAYTSVATSDGNIYFNSTGNPGMAKGGSGDVLTGILTGLLAQGYMAEDAAMIGVYLHGLAGDIACEEKGENSMIASDIIDFLPQAFKKIVEPHNKLKNTPA